MRILIIGLGSIGRRHARILINNFKHDLYAFRSSPSPINHVDGVNEIKTWKEVFDLNPDFALIANPTALHIRTAIKCAKNGINLFIEKPIDCKSHGLALLKNIVKEKKLTTYIAYNMRFHPVIQRLKEFTSLYSIVHLQSICSSYLPDWRPHQDHKKSYSANIKLGGGVLLDLSHELDYCKYLLDAPLSLSGRSGKIGRITNDSDDYADIIISSSAGIGNIHLDYFGHKTVRTVNITFDNFTVSGDLLANTVVTYKRGVIVSQEKFDIDPDFIYKIQIEYFLKNYNNPFMQNNIFEASELFEEVLRFVRKDIYG